MVASKKITQFLNENKVDFELLEHPAAFTAQEIAGEQHVPGRIVAKCVILKIDGKPVMCVVSAVQRVDMQAIKKITGASDVKLADESETANIFPDYEVGAEPPFGNLYGLEVMVEKALQNEDEIIFNAGTHTDMIKMNYKDFEKLAKPKVEAFGLNI